MDLKLAIVGSLPPALAALAEWLTPVTREAVKGRLAAAELNMFPPTPDQIAMFRPPAPTGDAAADEKAAEEAKSVREKLANLPIQVADFAAETAEGAAEASAILPTWIGVTTAAVAAGTEVFPPEWVAIGAALWTAGFGVAAPRLFSGLSYRNLAMWQSELPFCGGRSQADCLSKAMILANVVAIAFVLGVAAMKPGEEGGHRQHEPAARIQGSSPGIPAPDRGSVPPARGLHDGPGTPSPPG